MLGRCLKMTFWVVYDHTGKLMLASLCWSLAPAVPMYYALGLLFGDAPSANVAEIAILTFLSLGILLPLMTAGMAHLVAVLIEKKDGEFSDFFRGIRQHAARAIQAGVLLGVIGACLATSVWFYAGAFPEKAPLLGYTISMFAGWCLAFLGFTTIYAIPALVQKRGTLRDVLRLSAMLCVDNPILTFGLALQMLCFLLLCMVVTPLLFLLLGALCVTLSSCAYELLSRKYARLQSQRDGDPQGDASIIDDSQDDYLNRGFRDFLFPWKG